MSINEVITICRHTCESKCVGERVENLAHKLKWKTIRQSKTSLAVSFTVRSSSKAIYWVSIVDSRRCVERLKHYRLNCWANLQLIKQGKCFFVLFWLCKKTLRKTWKARRNVGQSTIPIPRILLSRLSCKPEQIALIASSKALACVSKISAFIFQFFIHFCSICFHLENATLALSSNFAAALSICLIAHNFFHCSSPENVSRRIIC